MPKYYTPLNDDLYIAGSFNSWQPNDIRYKFQKVATNTYKSTFSLPVGTYQYKITRGSWGNGESNADGSIMFNRNLVVTSGGQNVNIVISNWDDFKGSHTASGNVHVIDRQYPYPQFNTTKRIWVYLPADYYTTIQRYPVFYMHDGQNLFDSLYSFAGEWGVDEAMEKFFIQQKPSSIIVGIETTENRISELTPYSNPQYGGGKADLYLDFLVNNLKPYVDSQFRTKPERQFTGIAGSSLGGLFSFYAGLKNQNIFSKVGIFSPSFWYSSQIYDFALNTPKQYEDFKMYFYCGGRESESMVSDMLNMMNVLSLKSYSKMKSSVASDGQHNEYFWRNEFPNLYEWLYLI